MLLCRNAVSAHAAHLTPSLPPAPRQVMDKLQLDQVTEGPGEGAYVHGMHLTGARWDYRTHKLTEPRPKELFSAAPVLWFKPGMAAMKPSYPHYACPLYNTSERRGVLSTTGHSTNFVLWVHLASDEAEDHWVLRGTAMVLQAP